jgi:hypothetical protein
MLAYSPLAQASMGATRRLGDSRIGVSAYTGRQGDIRAHGALVQIETGPSSIKLGLVDEAGSVFGTPVGAGIMRFGDGARTYFVEAAGGVDLGTFSLEGFASMGATRLRLGDDTLLTGAELITTGRYGLALGREALGGRISFGLGQPLIVLGGDATFTLGDGYDLDTRSLLFAERRVNLSGTLAPQFTFGFEKRGERSDFRIGAASDAHGRDVRGIIAWNLRFGE